MIADLTYGDRITVLFAGEEQEGLYVYAKDLGTAGKAAIVRLTTGGKDKQIDFEMILSKTGRDDYTGAI